MTMTPSAPRSLARLAPLSSRLRRAAIALVGHAPTPGGHGASPVGRRATGSLWSISSRGSLGSIASIGSVGSMASVGSSGSLVSIGSVGSIASIASAGCILSVGSSGMRGAFFGVPVLDLLRRRRGTEPTGEPDDRSLGGGPGED